MYKRFIENKKAVFFDLDGTLIDSEPLWRKAIENVLEKYNLSWADQEPVLPGTTLEERWKYFTKEYKDYFEKKMEIQELIKLTNEEFLEILNTNDLEFISGFWSLAAKLKGKELKICLVTNSTREVTEKVLDKLQAKEAFDLILCGDDVKNKKPDPEIFLTAAKQMNLQPEEVLVFEDSIAGTTAASNAKMDTVVIWNGITNKLLYPKDMLLYIPDFEGLDQLLETYPEDQIQMAADAALREKELTQQENNQNDSTDIA